MWHSYANCQIRTYRLLIVHELHVCVGELIHKCIFFPPGELSVANQKPLHRQRRWIFSWNILLYQKTKSHDSGAFSGPTFWIEMSSKISTLINRQRALVYPDCAACRHCYHHIFLSSNPIFSSLVDKASGVKIYDANTPIKFSGFEQFAPLLRQVAIVTIGKWKYGLLPQTQKW